MFLSEGLGGRLVLRVGVVFVAVAAVLAVRGAVLAAEVKKGAFTVSDGTTLNYLEAGSGPPVVLVPGWSQTAAMFEAQFEGLGGSYRVIAVDMRGHGDSGKPDHGYRIARLAADLHEFLTGLGLEDVALGGHSMGVSILWSYWEHYRDDRVSKLIFIDQAPSCMAMPNWSEEQVAEVGALFTPQSLYDTAVALAGAEGRTTTEGLVNDMFFTAAYPADRKTWVLAENLKMPRDHGAALLIDHCTKDWRDIIPSIDVPTVVFGGEASFFTPKSQHWVADRIGAEIHVFGADEGGSHFMFMENPEKFNALLSAFLAE